MPAPSKTPTIERWGLDSFEVLERLQNKQVQIVMANGDILAGWLLGYGRYSLTLKVGDSVLLVNKAAMATLKPEKDAVTPRA
jgi:sRNA-binding regulator protein Hfq